MKLTKFMFILAIVNFLATSGVIYYSNSIPDAQIITAQTIGTSDQPPVLTPTVPPVKTITSTPTKSNPQATSPPAVPTTDPRCLVTLSGHVYDLTQFRGIHSGGDIFQCGTDMTAIFNGQHPSSYLDQLSKYKIN